MEGRQLHAFALEALAVDFPFARSVIVVRSEITVKKTGKTTTDTRYYLSSAVLPNHFGEKSLQEIHEDLHSKPGACLRVMRSK